MTPSEAVQEFAAYREHFDSGVAFLQLGLSPESLAKVLARPNAS